MYMIIYTIIPVFARVRMKKKVLPYFNCEREEKNVEHKGVMVVVWAMQLALQAGFSRAAPLKTEALRADPRVRSMCADGRCKRYGKCWSCPPGCGSIEDCQKKMDAYAQGILVQTTAQLEDEFDAEGMAAAEKRHKKAFETLSRQMRSRYPDCLPLTAGGCSFCRKCTYPDKPCRFPHKSLSSMEAYGLLVSEVCSRSDLGYYYGPGTITYTSCILWNEQ